VVLRLGSAGTTSLGGGNTSLLGGVLELTAASGDLTALAWGAGAGQINLNGGGFSAYDADRTVSFTTTGTWGAGSGFSGSSLTLSSVAAGAKITFASDINLNTGAGSSRTITVNNGSADADAEISGVLSGGQANSTLIKSGAGTLVLSTTNTYTGTTSVQAGVLRLGANNVFADTSKMLVDGGVLDINSRTDTVSSVTLKSGLIAGTTGTLTSTSTFAVESGTISSRLGGSVGLTKSTSGTATLSGGNVYTGATTVSAGTLLVSSAGSLASSGVTVDGGAQFVYNNNTTGYTGNVTVNGALGGSGRLLGTISGTGQVGPGNSPGILTAAAVNPAGGLDFAFEFTATGSPNYGNNTASVNDVLRLTDATTPFTASLNSSNTIKIYLNVGSLTSGDIFYGGFYADQGVSFLGSISAATYEYYLFNASGAFTYNGTNYDLYTGPFTVDVNTVAQTANFTGADINGYVTEFTVVPEPRSISMLLAGAALTIVLALRRRRA